MLEVLLRIQHDLNPLHLYCRLIERGLDKDVSISVCRYYEILIFSWLGWLTAFGVGFYRFLKPTS